MFIRQIFTGEGKLLPNCSRWPMVAWNIGVQDFAHTQAWFDRIAERLVEGCGRFVRRLQLEIYLHAADPCEDFFSEAY
jgi:hypothetical protein